MQPLRLLGVSVLTVLVLLGITHWLDPPPAQLPRLPAHGDGYGDLGVQVGARGEARRSDEEPTVRRRPAVPTDHPPAALHSDGAPAAGERGILPPPPPPESKAASPGSASTDAEDVVEGDSEHVFLAAPEHPAGDGCTYANRAVECFDPATACADLPLPARRAFVFAHDLQIPFGSTLPKLVGLGHLVRHFHPPRVEAVLLVPRDSKHPLSREERDALAAAGIQILEQPYPAMSQAVRDNGERLSNCCGWQEYLKLRAFALDQYDAVIFLDSDETILESLEPLFRCASKYFLTTSGAFSGLNGGFFLGAPSKPLYAKMEEVLRTATYTTESGWEGLGFPPNDHMQKPTHGAEGPQGFLYFFFYQPGSAKWTSYEGDKPIGHQLSRCRYNYIRESDHNKRCSATVKPAFVHKFEGHRESYRKSLMDSLNRESKALLTSLLLQAATSTVPPETLPPPTEPEGETPPRPLGSTTCLRGNAMVDCLDVETCADEPWTDEDEGKTAFVFSVDPGTHLADVTQTATVLRYYHPKASFVVLVVSNVIDAIQTRFLSRVGVEVKLVDSPHPSPSLKASIEKNIPKAYTESSFSITNLWSLTEFNTIVLLDARMEIHGAITPLLKCSRGRIITTSGPHCPVNLGLMVFEPKRSTQKLLRSTIESVDFSQATGYNGHGFAPTDRIKAGYNPGMEDMAGMVYYLFYQLGVEDVQASQVSRCQWNYMRESEFPNNRCDPENNPPTLVHFYETRREARDYLFMTSMREAHQASLEKIRKESMASRSADSLVALSQFTTPLEHLRAYRREVEASNTDFRMHVVHVPKSAGTSLSIPIRRALCKLAAKGSESDCCAPDGYCEPERGKRCTAVMNECRGHHPLLTFMLEGIPSATILRHPVDRSVSAYFYKCHNPNYDCYHVRPYFTDIFHSRMPKVSFLDYQKMLEYTNIQTRMFGTDSFPYSAVEVGDKELAKAKAVLDNFFFVGLTEAYNTSVLLLLHDLELPLDPEEDFRPSGERSMHVHNPLRKEIKTNQTLRAIVGKANSFDVQLYNHAVKLFCTRLAKAGLLDHPIARAEMTRKRKLFSTEPACHMPS